MQSVCLCVSNNYECMHNPTFYIIKRKLCKFKIYSIMSSFCNIFLLMQVLYHVLCTRMKVW